MSNGVHRWYKAFECTGKPEQRIQQIGNLVRNCGLQRYIPVVRVEKKARGKFFVFVAVESQELGRVPPEVESFFNCGFLGMPFPGMFGIEQIRGMVTGEVDVQDFARGITYRSPGAFIWDDPFADAAQYEDVDDILLQSQRFERFLSWLSATGSGTWQSFQQAARILGLTQEGASFQSGRILRNLRLLGHVETSPDGSHWSISPSMLTQISAAGNSLPMTFVLCGARDNALLGLLREIADVEERPQSEGNGPPSVCVSADPEDLRRALADRAFIGENASKAIADALPAVVEWPAILSELPNLDPAMYDCMKFDGDVFLDSVFTGRAGLYQFWPAGSTVSDRTPVRPTYTAFYDARTSRWVRGDGFGLRYLSRIADGERCQVYYNLDEAQLVVPFRWHWPELYERTVVLASGRLPTLTSDRSRLIYADVPEDLLDRLTPKMGLRRDDELSAARSGPALVLTA